MKEKNYILPNKLELKNKTNKRYRPYSSQIVEKKNYVRVLSSGNINNLKNSKIDIYKSYSILPTLNIKNQTVKIKRNILNNSMEKKNNFKIELEQLYDQNMNYKKTIIKMQTEINMIKNELNQKQKILNIMNEDIEQILTDNKDVLNLDITKSTIPESERGRYAMIGKMKNKIKEAEAGLKNENFNNKKYKKNIKFTKSKELELEQKIINEQTGKILILIENSLKLKNSQIKEIEENKIYLNNLKPQQKIIHNFEQKLQRLKNEENKIKKDILKYEAFVNKTNNKIKIIQLKQNSLKNQNDILKKEKNKFKKDVDTELNKLNSSLSAAKNEYNYQKKRNEQVYKQLEIVRNQFEKEKELESSSQSENEEEKGNDKDKNITKINREENVEKLKKLYKEHRDKENDLEKNINIYKDAVQKMKKGEKINIEEIKKKIEEIINRKIEIENIDDHDNKEENNDSDNGSESSAEEEEKQNKDKDLILSENNPYYTNLKDNYPMISNKFNNAQYSQFIYILFKNFQAKKINKEKAQKEIITPLMKDFNEINKDNRDSIKNEKSIKNKLEKKFGEVVLKLLNCNNENDINNLKIFFNAIYHEKVTNSKNKNDKNNNDDSNKLELMNDYFLSFFNDMHDYNQNEEIKLKKKLKTKYETNLTKLINVIKEYILSKKDKDNKNNEENKNKEEKKEDNKKEENKIKDNKNKEEKKEDDKKNENINNNKLDECISFQEIKNILDKNKDINLRQKYIEFIIYYMKQFDDNKASLYDLKISKLDEILNEEIKEDKNKDKNKNEKNVDNKENEKTAEITLEEFNKNINSVLVVIKQLMMDEKKDIRKLFCDSIKKINNPDTDIITLESLNNELNKRKINLNKLQISCINQKYCVNEEMNALEIKQIEDDINNLKK